MNSTWDEVSQPLNIWALRPHWHGFLCFVSFALITHWHTVPAAVSTACPLWTESGALGCSLQLSGLYPVKRKKQNINKECVILNQCFILTCGGLDHTHSLSQSLSLQSQHPLHLIHTAKQHVTCFYFDIARGTVGKADYGKWRLCSVREITTWRKWPTHSSSVSQHRSLSIWQPFPLQEAIVMVVVLQ